MSARAKTSDREICEAVCELLEKDGEGSLSMQMIANAVGVRAPSLYKRFTNKADLLGAAARQALSELPELLNDPAAGRQPYESLERMAHLYRKFAKKRPRTYALIFSESMALREDLLLARQAAVQPMLAVLERAVGKDAAQRATQMLASYLHGFLSMELTKAFRAGGNVNEGFQFGLSKALDALLGKRAQGA
jgi:AcrR family transcriptional regulator